jgi:hypothetical protein
MLCGYKSNFCGKGKANMRMGYTRLRVVAGLLGASLLLAPLAYGDSPDTDDGTRNLAQRDGVSGSNKPPTAMAVQQIQQQIETIRLAMMQELREHLATLREHSRAVDEIPDEKRLLVEVKKHLRMTDELLGLLIEQREQMEAKAKALREQMQSQMKEALESKLKGLHQQMQSRRGQGLAGSGVAPQGSQETPQ